MITDLSEGFGGDRPSAADDAHQTFLASVGAGQQVLARDRDDPAGKLLFVAPGGAEKWRGHADQGRLRCPAPVCSDRPMTVVNNGEQRHHFRHLTAPDGSHSTPETIDHLTAKTVLEHWVLSQAPDAVIRRDGFRLPSGQVPDLLAIIDGNPVAFEVQYSQLSPDAWLKRHQKYAAARVADVWLFSHRGKLCRQATVPRRAAPGLWLKVPAVGRYLLAAGLPLMWINPGEKLIATAELSWSDMLKARAPKSVPSPVPVTVETLADCRLSFDQRVTFDDHIWYEKYRDMRKIVIPDAHGLRTPATDAALRAYAPMVETWTSRVPAAASTEPGRVAEPIAVEPVVDVPRPRRPSKALRSRFGEGLPAIIGEDLTGTKLGTVAEMEWRLEILHIFDKIAPAAVNAWWLADALRQARLEATTTLPEMASAIAAFLPVAGRRRYVGPGKPLDYGTLDYVSVDQVIYVYRGLREKPRFAMTRVRRLLGSADMDRVKPVETQLDLFDLLG